MKRKITIISIFLFLAIVIISLSLVSRLKTRVITLEKNGKTITLVGVMHTGTQSYFHQLQDILDQQSVVLFEGIRDGDGLESILQPYRVMADMLGLEFQGDAITYRDEWIYSDVDYSTACQFSDCQELTEVADTLASLKGLSGPLIKFLIGLNAYHSIHFEDDPFVYIRNYHPILKAFDLLQENDTVALFYGEAHIRHMLKVFKAAGYRKAEIQVLFPFEMRGSKS